jgi:hypothetical protein
MPGCVRVERNDNSSYLQNKHFTIFPHTLYIFTIDYETYCVDHDGSQETNGHHSATLYWKLAFMESQDDHDTPVKWELRQVVDQ